MANIPIERKRSASIWPMLLGLLGLIALGVFLMRGCNRTDGTATTADSTAAVAPAPAAVTGGAWNSDFGFTQTANSIVLRGKVPTEAAKATLLDQLRGVYPGVTINADSLTVEAGAATSAMMDKAGSLFGYLSQVRNASLGLGGQALTVRGDVRSQAAKDDVSGDLTSALPPGYTLANEINVVAPPPDVAAADSLISAALVSPIPFATGSATLGEGAAAILDQVAAALTQYGSVRVVVEGHTDNTGDAAANQQLSEQRAQSVMRYLTEKGIAAARMTAVGYGQTRPRADNGTEEGKAQNRRVVFSVDQ